MRYRWLVFALIVGVLAFVAAGCGGDDDGGRRRGQRGRHRRHLGHGDLGRRGAGVVPGRDRRLQRALPERQRQVHVRRRQPRAAALDRGRRRQSARHRGGRPARADGRASPSRARSSRSTTCARRSSTTSANRSRTSARSTGRSTGSCSRAPTSRPSGTTSRPSRRPASSAPETWEELSEAPRHAQGRGDHPVLGRRRRRLADDGHLREHLPPHRGRRDVRPARARTRSRGRISP